MIHLGELLSAHLDGELSLDEARLVAGHLEVCGACRAEFDDLAAARAAVRTLPALELPESIGAAIPSTERRRPRMPAQQWAAVAAAVLALAVGSATLFDDAPPEPVPFRCYLWRRYFGAIRIAPSRRITSPFR